MGPVTQALERSGIFSTVNSSLLIGQEHMEASAQTANASIGLSMALGTRLSKSNLFIELILLLLPHHVLQMKKLVPREVEELE